MGNEAVVAWAESINGKVMSTRAVIPNYDEEALFLVSGFARGIQFAREIMTLLGAEKLIPQDIIEMCVSFYKSDEYFVDDGHHFTIDTDKSTISKLSDCNCDWRSVFGNVSVYSMSARVHSWKFKVRYTALAISISSNDSNR